MKKIVLAFLALLAAPAFAQTAAVNGFCTLGAANSVTSGLNSSNKLQGIIPKCTVTVYRTGTTTKPTIYSNLAGTTLTNPFTADVLGKWLFFTQTGVGVDIVMSGGTAPLVYASPQSLTDVVVGGGGGSGCTAPGVTHAIIYDNGAGGCGGSAHATLDQYGIMNLSGGGNLEVDSAATSTGSQYVFTDGDHIYEYSTGAGNNFGGIQMTVSDKDYTGIATGMVPFYLTATVTRNGKNAIGYEADILAASGVSAGSVIGFLAGANTQGLAQSVHGFENAGAGINAAGEEFSFLAHTANASPFLNENYCDYYAIPNLEGYPPRLALGCGNDGRSTFYGPVTVPTLATGLNCTSCAGYVAFGIGTVPALVTGSVIVAAPTSGGGYSMTLPPGLGTVGQTLKIITVTGSRIVLGWGP